MRSSDSVISTVETGQPPEEAVLHSVPGPQVPSATRPRSSVVDKRLPDQTASVVKSFRTEIPLRYHTCRPLEAPGQKARRRPRGGLLLMLDDDCSPEKRGTSKKPANCHAQPRGEAVAASRIDFLRTRAAPSTRSGPWRETPDIRQELLPSPASRQRRGLLRVFHHHASFTAIPGRKISPLFDERGGFPVSQDKELALRWSAGGARVFSARGPWLIYQDCEKFESLPAVPPEILPVRPGRRPDRCGGTAPSSDAPTTADFFGFPGGDSRATNDWGRGEMPGGAGHCLRSCFLPGLDTMPERTAPE